MLIVLANENKPRDRNSVDRIVSSEIPDADQNPQLYEMVKSRMIHGPYGVLNKNSPCMQDGKCTKEIPKELRNETAPNKDGYPRYRKRDNEVIAKVGKYEVDNRKVILYNPRLLMKWDAHINVKVCATVKSIKYLFKYVYKGHHCANIKLELPVKDCANFAKTLQWNKIKAHLDARYAGAPEAVWRLFEFPLHDKSHSIIRLVIHLPIMQSVYFAEGNELEALDRATEKDKTLIAWFKLNRDNLDARRYLYHDILNHFVFDRETNGSVDSKCDPSLTLTAEDFMRYFDAETAEAMVLYDIEAMLAEQGRSFSDFVILIPSMFCPL
ncbi:unnamed protein product [Rotaria socialis]|uniref:Uncharacterized protein n=1 Tax=Rotaria socialis TaxID=392032 RepID=A0A817ZAH7_9BILA|nr:unnamed protein product [Rotaria socialis]